ncbi:hypothetical protein [Nonomuraea dietziae]|uniref:hypothetical protein n=1 Tax=Nonomuraea dietziae TaxID=65515 RepID=UPI003440F2FC
MTNGPKAYRPRKPQHPPSASDLAERDRFAALAQSSLATVKAGAEAWRNGLAAFITLVTTGVVIKGRDTTANLSPEWRVAVTLFIGLGLALSLLGLWQALSAQAGTKEGVITLEDIHRRHASVTAYQVALARTAAGRLARARILVGIALASLLLGIIATWWAPDSTAGPPAYLKVTHTGGVTCGELKSADAGTVRLKIAGAHDAAAIPVGTIGNMAVVAACP